MKKLSIVTSLAALALTTQGFAAVPTWQIVPAQSHITFTATQNNAPVTGQFNQFAGNIEFDPNQLSADQVTMTVNMASVNASYGEIADTLKSADWFNVQQFPKATFTAKDFVKTGDNQYQAKGTLTLRDKSLPVVLNFSLTTYTATQAVAKGSAQISRLQFGVGQGQWANTDAIKDNVQIQFVIAATK